MPTKTSVAIVPAAAAAGASQPTRATTWRFHGARLSSATPGFCRPASSTSSTSSSPRRPIRLHPPARPSSRKSACTRPSALRPHRAPVSVSQPHLRRQLRGARTRGSGAGQERLVVAPPGRPRFARREVRLRLQPRAVRRRLAGQPERHLSVLDRSVLQPRRPGLDRRTCRTPFCTRRRRRPRSPGCRRSISPSSSRTTGGQPAG